MRTRRRQLLSALAAPLVALAAACGDVKRQSAPVDTALVLPPVDTAAPGTRDTTGTARVDSTAAAPAPATSTVVLLSDSAAGDTIFHGKGRCFTCHRARGEGVAKLGPSLTDSVWLAGSGSLGEIESIIANGVAAPRAGTGTMPAFAATLAPEEIARVAAYVYALSHPGSAAADTARADSAAHALSAPATDTALAPR